MKLIRNNKICKKCNQDNIFEIKYIDALIHDTEAMKILENLSSSDKIKITICDHEELIKEQTNLKNKGYMMDKKIYIYK